MLNYPENLSNDISAYRLNERGLSGYYPIGVGNFWHSGIHLPISSDTPIKPLIIGKVIAYRIDKNYRTIDLPQKLTQEMLDEKYCKHKSFYNLEDDIYYLNKDIPDNERKISFASNFILLEHFIQDNDGKKELKFYTLYTNIGSSWEKQAYQEDFITDGKIHILKDKERFSCTKIGPAGYDRDDKYIEISCFMEKSLFNIKFKSKKPIFLSAKKYKNFYSRENVKCTKKQFYFTNRSHYCVLETITSGSQTAKKIQLKNLAVYLPEGVDTISGRKTKIKDKALIEYVTLNKTSVSKDKTSEYNLIDSSLNLFFYNCIEGSEYTVTNTYNNQTQILIDCSFCKPVWIVDNDDFTSDLDVEVTYNTNGYVDYYEDCPLFYSFTKKEIKETNEIIGLKDITYFDKNKNEYCEVDGLSGVYVKKRDFEEKCYENALNWKAFFDNQEEFDDDIFCDKLSILKKIDDSSVFKNIFGNNRIICDDEMERLFGPKEHSPEMKEVVKKLRKIECRHPLEFDKSKFEKIADAYNKRKEYTIGSISDMNAKILKEQAELRDIWTDGLCKIFKKNNFFFVHPVYFLNHLDKAGLLEFNPYQGKKYRDVYKNLSELRKIYDQNSTALKKADKKIVLPKDWKVIDNPGFSTYIKNNVELQGYGKVTGLFNEDYLDVTRYIINGVKHPYSEYRYYYYHFGIDFEGKKNTEIKSFIYGTVVAMNWISSNGRCLLVQGKTSKKLYMLCHLSSYSKDIKVGTIIYPGQIVARVGGSGGGFDKEGSDCNSETTFSPHLHISVIPCKKNVYLSDVQMNKSKKVACTGNKEEWINLKNEYKTYIDPFNYNKQGGGYAEK